MPVNNVDPSTEINNFDRKNIWPTHVEGVPSLDNINSLPALLLHNVNHHAAEVAMREKEFGIWQSYTWNDYYTHVRNIGLAMADMGFKKGDVAVIIGDNRPAWIWSEIAIQANRGMSLGIYRDALEEEILFLIDYAKPKFIFAEDEEQVDKFLSLGDRIPSVKKIVYADPRGMRKYDDERLISLEDFEEIGRLIQSNDNGIFRRFIKKIELKDIAVLCATSGTTGNPKLTMLSHKALLHHCLSYLQADPKNSNDEYVSTLPLSWIMEQIYAVGWSLLSRMKINFVEEAETMMADFREIGPTFVLFAPRLWEQIAGDVRANIMDADKFKQFMFEFGMARGIKAVENGTRSKLADILLFKALKDRLGLSNVTSAATGGAALGPDTFKFFLAMGVPLRQLYGQTESLGAYTLHEMDDVDFDSVGHAFNDVEMVIDNADKEGIGEVVVRHDNMMDGYYLNEDATKEAFTQNNWMRTGDAGYYNKSGHLIIIDRISDLAQTNSGKRFSPAYIENKLKFSAYIAEAVILGNKQDYLTAIICIRFPIVSKWAEKNRISFTTYTDLSAREETYNILRDEVEIVNKTLPEAQKIKKFIFIQDPCNRMILSTRA
ncbi:MAG: AMP-binding protein [Rhizobiales bacterium]|nr:AMP-binding protein [Hyphomicrobiales bacterium]